MTGFIALMAGALGSVALVFYAGRVNSPAILLMLFAFWVLAPFVGLGAAAKASPRWPHRARRAIGVLTILAPLCSLALYGRAAMQPMGHQVTAMFLMVPLATWVAIGIAVAMRALKR